MFESGSGHKTNEWCNLCRDVVRDAMIFERTAGDMRSERIGAQSLYRVSLTEK